VGALTAARVVLVGGGRAVRTGGLKSARLAAGAVAWDGGIACIDTAAPGGLVPAGPSTTLRPVGTFTRSVDNSASGTPVGVGIEFFRERWIAYWDSVTGAGAITLADLYSTVFLASDHELTTDPTGASPYGVVWELFPLGYPTGIGVEAVY
jgi:hypothetical protein